MKIPALLLSACIGLSLTACVTRTVKPSPAEQFLQPTTIEGQYRSLDSLIADPASTPFSLYQFSGNAEDATNRCNADKASALVVIKGTGK